MIDQKLNPKDFQVSSQGSSAQDRFERGVLRACFVLGTALIGLLCAISYGVFQ